MIIIIAPGLLILLLVAWNVLAWQRIKIRQTTCTDTVSVLIPARNEENNIPACLDAVLKQGEVVAEVLIYDDHSSDATSKIVREYANRDLRVRLIASEELPDGWCGKN